jgi:SAM-dependent methyltransferase
MNLAGPQARTRLGMLARKVLPERVGVALTRRRYASTSLPEAFTAIYEQNLWGGEPGEYTSGSGSVPAVADEYARRIRELIAERGHRSVLDLGCGDFQVGTLIAESGVRYRGADVVPGLIAANQDKYGNERISFTCLDISQDALPSADLCLVRQVLQHLSNAEIRDVLGNVRRSRFAEVLITEIVPAGHIAHPNLDKPHGPDTRLSDGSGVLLEEPPFSEQVEHLIEYELPDGKSVLRTSRLL